MDNNYNSNSKPTAKPPVKNYKAGAISVAVWEQEAENKRSFYTVTYSRSYKDKNDQWQKTNSLRINDLPILNLLLKEAYRDFMLKKEE